MKKNDFMFALLFGILHVKDIISKEELDSINAYMSDNSSELLEEERLYELLRLLE